MQKIAIPVSDSKLSPRFASSLLFQIFLIDGRGIIKEYIIRPPSPPSELLVVWLANEGITDVITNGITHEEIGFFNQHKINVFVGVKMKSPSNLVKDYIDGILETHDNLIIP